MVQINAEWTLRSAKFLSPPCWSGQGGGLIQTPTHSYNPASNQLRNRRTGVVAVVVVAPTTMNATSLQTGADVDALVAAVNATGLSI
jgi:hypothetical protein